MIAFSLDITTLLPIAIFGLIAAGVWLLLDTFSGRKNNAETRLDFIRGAKSKASSGKTKGEAVSDLLEKTQALSRPLKPKTEEEQGKIALKLSYAGFRRETASSVFLGMKFMLLIIGIVLGGGTALLRCGVNKDALIQLVLSAGFMFYLPDIVVWFIAKKRKEAIFLSLPDTLDLMVVCVEAGLGLDQAMRKVAEEMKKTYKIICDELNLCNLQLQMGKTRTEVLQDLGARTGVDDLRALAAILIQADKFGSSVGKALRVQSDSMRTRRRQLAEEKAAKTAVQLIFPMVLFIFPGVFVVLVGPAGITMMRQMFPMMQSAGG